MKIKKVEWLGLITGDESVNKTNTKYKLGGTDLGFPMYSERNGKMYYFFGDTFTDNVTMTGDWRSDVVGYGNAEDLIKELKIEGFIVKDGRAYPLIEGTHTYRDERTKIPTGAIEIDGVMYMFYFSKFDWVAQKVAREKSMNYGGCIKSIDGGNTWERVYDLSWVDHTVGGETGGYEGNSPERIKELIEQDINLQPSNIDFDMKQHEGYYFTQIAPVDGKDGYVYIFGEGGYRTEGIKLGRVKKNTTDFENFEAYEYLVGFNGTDPIWKKGSQGLKECSAKKEAFIVNDACSEMTVSYNKYLNKWILSYLVSEDKIPTIIARTADTLWGPYSDAVKVIDGNYPFPNKGTNIYAGFTHEKLMEEEGKIVYMIISQFLPVYNSSLVKIILE